jgi:NAD(P)-dependent dehydrogenase (short-subunit alcohol dehydrogenase family)
MTNDIAGRVAVVTGASSGLGERFARVLAAEGAHLAIAARRVERLEGLAAELRETGVTVVPVSLDVTSVAAIREAAALIERQLGPIEILVNNAGISRQARLETIEEGDYDAVLDTNLKGPFFMAQAAAKQMMAHKIEGRIVNIASVAGERAVAQLSTYGMSKAGMIQMTRQMAREWGRYGININALCPGYITTEISEDYLKTEAGAKWVAQLPRKRMGEPGDLDGILKLLCSGQASRFINGAVIAADDGFLAT